jgi:hypothetical protein
MTKTPLKIKIKLHSFKRRNPEDLAECSNQFFNKIVKTT